MSRKGENEIEKRNYYILAVDQSFFSLLKLECGVRISDESPPHTKGLNRKWETEWCSSTYAYAPVVVDTKRTVGS